MGTLRIPEFIRLFPDFNGAVLFGDFTSAPPPPSNEGTDWKVVSAGPGVLFAGDPESVAAALTVWNTVPAEPPAWASRIKELSSVYDNWAFIRNPIPAIDKGIAPAPMPNWKALQESVVDVSAGLRLGATIDCFASATMASFDDAASGAALARWFPAFAESHLRGHPELFGKLEQFESRQNGRSVELRFSIQEREIPPPGIRGN